MRGGERQDNADGCERRDVQSTTFLSARKHTCAHLAVSSERYRTVTAASTQVEDRGRCRNTQVTVAPREPTPENALDAPVVFHITMWLCN